MTDLLNRQDERDDRALACGFVNDASDKNKLQFRSAFLVSVGKILLCPISTENAFTRVSENNSFCRKAGRRQALPARTLRKGSN